MDHPKDVGDRATLAIMSVLREAGYSISVPLGENTRYDLIADDGERLLRVQCKSGRLRDGAVRFPTCSTYVHHRNPLIARRDYTGEIDSFAVHCPETACVYLVPIEDVLARTWGSLRVEPARNGQRKHVRHETRFEVGRVSVSSTRALRASSGARGSSA